MTFENPTEQPQPVQNPDPDQSAQIIHPQPGQIPLPAIYNYNIIGEGIPSLASHRGYSPPSQQGEQTGQRQQRVQVNPTEHIQQEADLYTQQLSESTPGSAEFRRILNALDVLAREQIQADQDKNQTENGEPIPPQNGNGQKKQKTKQPDDTSPRKTTRVKTKDRGEKLNKNDDGDQGEETDGDNDNNTNREDEAGKQAEEKERQLQQAREQAEQMDREIIEQTNPIEERFRSLSELAGILDNPLAETKENLELSDDEMKKLMVDQPLFKNITHTNLRGVPLGLSVEINSPSINYSNKLTNKLVKFYYENPLDVMLRNAGLLFYSAEMTATPAQQAQMYKSIAKAVINIHKESARLDMVNHKSLLSRWLEAQSRPAGDMSNLDILKRIDSLPVDYIVANAFEDLQAKRPKFDQEKMVSFDDLENEWDKRITELEEALKSGSLKYYHYQWLDFLSRSINIEEMVNIAREKWKTTPPDNPDNNPPPDRKTVINSLKSDMEKERTKYLQEQKNLAEMRKVAPKGFKRMLMDIPLFGSLFGPDRETRLRYQNMINEQQDKVSEAEKRYHQTRDKFLIAQAKEHADTTVSADADNLTYRKALADRYIDSYYETESPVDKAYLEQFQADRYLQLADGLKKYPWWQRFVGGWAINAGIGLVSVASPPVALLLWLTRVGVGAVGTEALIHRIQAGRALDEYKNATEAEIAMMPDVLRRKKAAELYRHRLRLKQLPVSAGEKKLLKPNIAYNLNRADIVRDSDEAAINQAIIEGPENITIYETTRQEILDREQRDRSVRYLASVGAGILGTYLIDQFLIPVIKPVLEHGIGSLQPESAPLPAVHTTAPAVAVPAVHPPTAYLDSADPHIVHFADAPGASLRLDAVPPHHMVGGYEQVNPADLKQTLEAEFGHYTYNFSGPDKVVAANMDPQFGYSSEIGFNQGAEIAPYLTNNPSFDIHNANDLSAFSHAINADPNRYQTLLKVADVTNREILDPGIAKPGASGDWLLPHFITTGVYEGDSPLGPLQSYDFLKNTHDFFNRVE